VKKIVAFIKPHKLDEVVLALAGLEGLSGVSLSDVRGFGWGRGQKETVPFGDGSFRLLPGVRLEAVCLNQTVDTVVEAIETSAHTGLRGDGKIYISEVLEAVRISTGERGEKAV
jgi:nitrogen regulatory protein PII